jgi:anti-anti-sigma factor
MRFDDNSCGVSAEGVVEVVGEHDIASAPQLRAVLDRAASASSGSLRVDLSRASFIDSAVVAAIVDSARELVSRGRALVLGVAEGSTPAAVFAIVGLGEQPGVVIELAPALPEKR